MVDDMSGLFGFASEAYREGKRTGKDEFYLGIIAALGRIGVKHEAADNVAAFHAVEECTKAIVDLKKYHDGPKHAV